MGGQNKYLNFLILGVIGCAAVFIILMILFKPAHPGELINYLFNRTWSVDSALIGRKRTDLGSWEACEYINRVDTVWRYFFHVYARNRILPTLKVDSVVCIDFSTGERFKERNIWIAGTGRSSYLDRALGLCNFSVRGNYFWIRAQDKNILRTQELLDTAFRNRHFALIVYTDREMIRLTPTVYWSMNKDQIIIER